MNTSKPISTISYNSKDFLIKVLKDLEKKKIISFWAFIEHIGEYDEFGIIEKDHIHLYVEPNERLNTMKLGDYFIELDLNNANNKPLKCISWVSSKSDDWILYTLHDPEYLLTKFEARQYQYTYQNYVSSDDDDFGRRFKKAFQSSGYARNRNFYKYIENGGQLGELLEIGAVSPNQVQYYDDFFSAVNKSLRTKPGRKA